MTKENNPQPKPRKLRGTGIYQGNEFTFKPCEQGEPAQLNVKSCAGGGKRWVTTGADPSRMITLKCKESSADKYAELSKQFNALTKDLKPKKPVALPDSLRIVKEDDLQCWLDTEKGTMTFTGTIDLSKHPRDWQAELLRQVQLVVRRLPASERFNKVINLIKNGGTKQ